MNSPTNGLALCYHCNAAAATDTTVRARIQVECSNIARLVRIIVWGPVPAALPWIRRLAACVPHSHVSPILSVTVTLEKGAMYREQAQAPLRT